MKPEDFKEEMARAFKQYDQCVICILKTPDQFVAAMQSLMLKAIDSYEKISDGRLSHGIALDRDITIMISRREGHEKPYCNIYFNLHSDFRKHLSKKE